jgi:hypothetical protein
VNDLSAVTLLHAVCFQHHNEMKEETGPRNEAFKMLTHVFKLFITTVSVVYDVFNSIMLLVNYRGRTSLQIYFYPNVQSEAC